VVFRPKIQACIGLRVNVVFFIKIEKRDFTFVCFVTYVFSNEEHWVSALESLSLEQWQCEKSAGADYSYRP